MINNANALPPCSGKVGGRNDDVVITMCAQQDQIICTTATDLVNFVRRQLAVTGVRTFYQSEKYQNFRPSLM